MHTPKPWIVYMFVSNTGTAYQVLHHIETAVRINPKDYYESDYPVLTDEFGYFMPDNNINCESERIATANLIAAAPDLLEALQAMLGCCYDMERNVETIVAVKSAMEAIYKATGDMP